MTINKDKDSNFYEIRDAWDGAIYLTRENLKELRQEIDKFLNQSTEKKEVKPNKQKDTWWLD